MLVKHLILRLQAENPDSVVVIEANYDGLLEVKNLITTKGFLFTAYKQGLNYGEHSKDLQGDTAITILRV